MRSVIKQNQYLGLASLIVLTVLSGCTTIRGWADSFGQANPARKLTVDSAWVRSTLDHDFLGFRRSHRMTPLVLDNLVVSANAIDGIAAFDRKLGTQVWKLALENGVEGGAASDGGRLYFGASNGQFYCIDLADGRINWTFPVHAETLAPPTIDKGTVYFESGSGVVYALDAASGKQNWVYNRQVTSGIAVRATTRPTLTADRVFIGFSDGAVVALKRHDGALAWERKLGSGHRFQDIDSTPILDGENLYVASFDGVLVSMKAESGQVNWTVDEGGYVPVTLGSGSRSDLLYFATTNGLILVIDKKSGQQKAAFKVEHGIATQPVLYKNFLVYGESEGSLVVADADNGKQIAHYDPGHGLLAKPTVIDSTGELYFISGSANLYAMRIAYHRLSENLPWQK